MGPYMLVELDHVRGHIRLLHACVDQRRAQGEGALCSVHLHPLHTGQHGHHNVAGYGHPSANGVRLDAHHVQLYTANG